MSTIVSNLKSKKQTGKQTNRQTVDRQRQSALVHNPCTAYSEIAHLMTASLYIVIACVQPATHAVVCTRCWCRMEPFRYVE